MRRTSIERLLACAATALLSAAGAVLATWPLASRMATATLRSGEVLLTAWQLDWFQHALLTRPAVWVDANIFFPYHRASTFNDLLLTHAVVTLPAAWAESPVLALNLALLGGIVLCGVCACLLAEELTGDPWSAAVAGTLFALAPFRFLHLGHLSIAAAWPVPLFLWALLRHLREPSWGGAIVTSTSGVAVGLSSIYHAAYLAPIVPGVLLLGLRRGPGGRRAWIPLVVSGACGLAVLAWFVMPFADTMRSFGIASAPGDLLRYGADLTSLAQKPDFLGGQGESAGIDPEGHLYPGVAVGLLAALGMAIGLVSALAKRGWLRWVAVTVIVAAAVACAGLVAPAPGELGRAWAWVVLALVWAGPLVLLGWAAAAISRTEPVGPAVAIALGGAGVALSFVLALGPEARVFTEPLGRAPYWLLTRLSVSFEGTRVPARFGGISLLFLAVTAAGTLAALARAQRPALRVASGGLAVAALLACLAELPVPSLPRGRELVDLPELQDPAYAWLRSQPGRFGILELPDWPAEGPQHWRHRAWRSLRYMLASKQHGQHLVNGTGRIEPFLWTRFRGVELWSDGFFAFVASYLPVKYVLVHEQGLPPPSRAEAWQRIGAPASGWRELFRSPGGVRIFTVDRSAARDPVVDRVFVRHEIAPLADVSFSARLVEDAARAATTLELLRDGEPVGSWEIGTAWRDVRLTVPIDARAPARYDARCAAGQPPCSGWPHAGVLLRWRTQGGASVPVELSRLSVARARE